MWTFVLNDVEFREVTDLVKVDKVKIVACDGKSKFAVMAIQFLFLLKNHLRALIENIKQTKLLNAIRMGRWVCSWYCPWQVSITTFSHILIDRYQYDGLSPWPKVMVKSTLCMNGRT